MNKVSRILCLVLALLAPIFASETTAPQVRLLSERHRTEWNWVEYRITLTNTSKTAIRNPEVLYYAENSNIQYCENNPNNAWCASVLNGMKVADSSLQVAVDWSSLFNPVETNVESYGKITVIKLGFKGTFYPGKTMNVNFRIFRKDWAKWDCSRDISFQKTTEKSEPNYSMVVYDGDHNLLWGYNPFNGKSVADAFLWNDRSGITPVSQYNGDKSAVQKAGRFWMVKNSPLSNKEKEHLENIGVNRLTATALKGKTAILFKSTKDVKKRTLDSLVYGFYNSFNADDATKLKVEYEPEDWIAKQNVCDAGGSCHDVVWNKTSINMSTVCWEDVSIGDCRKVVEKCGGEGVKIENGLVWSKNTRKANECLAAHKDVCALEVERFSEIYDNDLGRLAVNIEKLQVDTWLNSLNINFTADGNVTDNWLANQKYTGEHVLAGVYDSGIYFDHDAFNEWKNGVKSPRKFDFPGALICENGCDPGEGDKWYHATHVAGILGGNGNGSKNHMYRGVAPKVLFYSWKMSWGNQYGHVVNHSHSGLSSYPLAQDRLLFENGEKSKDHLPKTSVFSAGNYAFGKIEDLSELNQKYYVKLPGDSDDFLETYLEKLNEGDEEFLKKNKRSVLNPCIYGTGFHSISNNTKNGIVVGNYASATGIPKTTSSYGPTWDGRIKPDVMAPGSGIEPWDEVNPFVIYFDYIKFANAGVEIHANDIPSDQLSCTGVAKYVLEEDSKSSNGKTLKMDLNDPEKDGECFYGPTDKLYKVKNGDEIRIRLKLSDKIRKFYYSNRMVADLHLYQNDETEKSMQLLLDVADKDGDYAETAFKWVENDFAFRKWSIVIAKGFNIRSSYPCSRESGGTCYEDMQGTSMAAPYVSGIVALMNQAYNQTIGTKINGYGFYTDGLRNSTSKAILIHTAHDMVDLTGFGKSVAYDVYAVENRGLPDNEKKVYHVTYGKGPDFVTGWGRVDGEAALHMFDDYNYGKKEFQKFREIEVGMGADKRFSLNVGSREHLRLTLAWDDFEGKELQNDLDMYLISPSGKYYFPWRLDTLSTEHLDENGIRQDECKAGLENISEEEAKKSAYNGCPVNNSSDESCFDHRNNVEVVDVDYPEVGTWTVVVRAKRIVEANGANGGQIASIASDVPLEDNPGNIGCDSDHPYPPQSRIQCSYYFGSNLENYVTFSPETSLGSGDFIELYDADWNELGTFTGTQLSGMRMRIDSDRLNVVLDSDNNPTAEGVDYGFSVQKIETIPYSMLFGIE